MSRLAVAAFIPSADAPISESVTASSTGAIHVIGPNRIFAINATQDITIAFGLSTGKVAAATSTSFRIPAGVSIQFDTGDAFDEFQVFNLGTAAATVYAILLKAN